MADGEVNFSGVDLVDLGILGGVEVHSELELFLGSVRDSVLRHVLDESLLEFKLFLGDSGVSEDSEDVLHIENWVFVNLKIIIIYQPRLYKLG